LPSPRVDAGATTMATVQIAKSTADRRRGFGRMISSVEKGSEPTRQR
jgi:hypothetical protein